MGKRGAVVIPASLRRRFGIEEGSLVIAEERPDGILIRPAVALPLESYTPERKAEFLLSNAVDAEDYPELYHVENGRGPDTDFYVRLAAELDARTILDLGCGTGLLTRDLAAGDRHVVGVDPSPAILAVARRQPNAERVQWIEGDSAAPGTPGADLVVMTGNVAQVFLEDAEWTRVLLDVRAALRPGCHLAFAVWLS